MRHLFSTLVCLFGLIPVMSAGQDAVVIAGGEAEGFAARCPGGLFIPIEDLVNYSGQDWTQAWTAYAKVPRGPLCPPPRRPPKPPGGGFSISSNWLGAPEDFYFVQGKALFPALKSRKDYPVLESVIERERLKGGQVYWVNPGLFEGTVPDVANHDVYIYVAP